MLLLELGQIVHILIYDDVQVVCRLMRGDISSRKALRHVVMGVKERIQRLLMEIGVAITRQRGLGLVIMESRISHLSHAGASRQGSGDAESRRKSRR
jgi:hypothetical protein